MSRPKILLFLSAVLLLSGVIFAHKISAGTADNLSGWAWSENIGWISFNAVNCGADSNGDNIYESSGAAGCPQPAGTTYANYGVRVTGDTLSGHAWSENIGWISFESSDLVGCPSGTCTAVLNRSTKMLNGWAKALAADGNGWDGWIHLSGTASDGSPYGVTVSSCDYESYAWGSDVIGWISFSGANYGVDGTGDACAPGVSITGDGSGGTVTVAYGGRVDICWNATQATDCTVDPTGWTGTSDCQTLDNLTSDTTLTVTCNAPGGQVSDSIFVDVEIPPLSASCSAAPSAVKAGETTAWSASATGGIGTYSFAWHGDSTLEGKTGTPVYISYDTTGTKSGSIDVTSGSDSLTAACGNTVSVSAGISEFSATPSRIVLGQSSTLSWKSVGLTSCSMNQGIGSVGLEGRKNVKPGVTTTYTLTCAGSSDERSVTVTVLQQPEFIEISPAEILP